MNNKDSIPKGLSNGFEGFRYSVLLDGLPDGGIVVDGVLHLRHVIVVISVCQRNDFVVYSGTFILNFLLQIIISLDDRIPFGFHPLCLILEHTRGSG